jgi:hypothetical protein
MGDMRPALPTTVSLRVSGANLKEAEPVIVISHGIFA